MYVKNLQNKKFSIFKFSLSKSDTFGQFQKEKCLQKDVACFIIQKQEMLVKLQISMNLTITLK